MAGGEFENRSRPSWQAVPIGVLITTAFGLAMTLQIGASHRLAMVAGAVAAGVVSGAVVAVLDHAPRGMVLGRFLTLLGLALPLVWLWISTLPSIGTVRPACWATVCIAVVGVAKNRRGPGAWRLASYLALVVSFVTSVLV